MPTNDEIAWLLFRECFDLIEVYKCREPVLHHRLLAVDMAKMIAERIYDATNDKQWEEILTILEEY